MKIGDIIRFKKIYKSDIKIGKIIYVSDDTQAIIVTNEDGTGERVVMGEIICVLDKEQNPEYFL